MLSFILKMKPEYFNKTRSETKINFSNLLSKMFQNHKFELKQEDGILWNAKMSSKQSDWNRSFHQPGQVRFVIDQFFMSVLCHEA